MFNLFKKRPKWIDFQRSLNILLNSKDKLEVLLITENPRPQLQVAYKSRLAEFNYQKEQTNNLIAVLDFNDENIKWLNTFMSSNYFDLSIKSKEEENYYYIELPTDENEVSKQIDDILRTVFNYKNSTVCQVAVIK